MPIPKCLQFLPCFPKKKPDPVDDGTDPDGTTEFSRKQIAKAVAIVLSGYDSEIAAASAGSTCTAEMVDLWVNQYRPPFFEDGMRCPPALIDWWMQELDRKEAEFAVSILLTDCSVTNSMQTTDVSGPLGP